MRYKGHWAGGCGETLGQSFCFSELLVVLFHKYLWSPTLGQAGIPVQRVEHELDRPGLCPRGPSILFPPLVCPAHSSGLTYDIRLNNFLGDAKADADAGRSLCR